ncbi:MAG TPA: hypothetical protein VNM66_06270 [Thermodesulfobacteriota bacterium]|nr:hypothetical protein [Thermodesulfobacteriota bacterium]
MSPGLRRGLVPLLVLAAALFAFNQTRLLARDLAVQRLGAARLLADQVRAEVEAELLAELDRLVVEPPVRQLLTAADIPAVATALRTRQGARTTVQAVGTGETLRIVTSGPFNAGTLWETTRAALEHGSGAGVEPDARTGELAIVAATRQASADGGVAAVAIARPLDESFAALLKARTGLDVTFYGTDGLRRASSLAEDGEREGGEPAPGGLWRRWERRQRPFVMASVSRAVAVDPVRTQQGRVVGVREMAAPLPYHEALRRLPTSRRFLLELLFLALAGFMAALLAGGAAGPPGRLERP